VAVSPFCTETLSSAETLILRPFEPEDVLKLEAYLNHPTLAGCRYLPWSFPDYLPLSRQQVTKIVEKWCQAEDGLNLAVVLRDGGNLIGHAECDWEWDPHNPSVSVVIDPAYQRQGFGSQALSLLLAYLYGYTPAHNVSCWIADWNQPALAFAAHHGFRECGRTRRAGIRQGAYFDVVVLDILRAEWQQGGGRHNAP
jgi:RimJ/RimL family protein N-acetyltransferase